MEWFENKLLELKRIYQGSQYEITKASFNEHCLNKGPTLSVIQSDNGRIFGGYTSKDWGKKDGNYSYYVEDDQAFIFSFDHKSKLKVKPDQKHEAIRNHHYLLSSFGGSGDLYTYDGKSYTKSNYSRLGKSF